MTLITIQTTIDANASAVWQAWTSPEHIMQWNHASDDWHSPAAENDLRVGGRYHIKMVVPDDTHDVSGVYREIVPNEKVSFTWAWKSTPERESLVTVTIKPDGDGSLMTLQHEQFFDETARDNHNKGWTAIMDRFANFVEA